MDEHCCTIFLGQRNITSNIKKIIWLGNQLGKWWNTSPWRINDCLLSEQDILVLIWKSYMRIFLGSEKLHKILFFQDWMFLNSILVQKCCTRSFSSRMGCSASSCRPGNSKHIDRWVFFLAIACQIWAQVYSTRSLWVLGFIFKKSWNGTKLLEN